MTDNSEGMTEKASVTINGEPVPCVESVEWTPDPIPKMIDIKADPAENLLSVTDILKSVSNPEWFGLTIRGESLGWIKNSEILGYDRPRICNPIRADFAPSHRFVELSGLKMAQYMNTAIFLYDAERECKEIHFVKE